MPETTNIIAFPVPCVQNRRLPATLLTRIPGEKFPQLVRDLVAAANTVHEATPAAGRLDDHMSNPSGKAISKRAARASKRFEELLDAMYAVPFDPCYSSIQGLAVAARYFTPHEMMLAGREECSPRDYATARLIEACLIAGGIRDESY